MNLSHVLKLASKFLVRGTVLRGAKHLAVKGGRVGIGAFSLLAGGYMAYNLMKKREEWMEEDKQLKKRNKNKAVD
ncbi:hypothetical protein [Christiangramia sp.]|uniref:hypothetical protein n=1 Tax=Christiangramia sp. TaxID=1931228 RepID=UPI0026310B86|nr:hypothetical protein [Christiangramia sp.]